MKRKLLFKGPLLTRSGYGEQSRFAIRALRSRPDLFDIFIQPLEWGKTSWINDSSDEKKWIDETIEKTIAFIHSGGTFDASFQVTIPNEWQNDLAPINIGFTAGIETTKVAHQWVQKGNEMNKIIVVSNHAKDVYKDTVFVAHDKQNQPVGELKLNTPIVAVNYPTKTYDKLPDLELDMTTDFNFLAVAQFGPRKNIGNTLRWFIEEFKDENVGLVLKTNLAKNCLMDRERVFYDIKNRLDAYKGRKCKLYLLHGDMNDDEMHALYTHPKINALLSLTHGEGFGLPLFEAAYSGLPTIAPGWSGQLDFLVNKNTNEDFYYKVEHTLNNIPKEVVWDGVIIEESSWAYPEENSSKQEMRRCYEDLTLDNAEATKEKFLQHANYLHEEFSKEKKYAEMVEAVCEAVHLSPNNNDLQDIDILEF
jgi:glycosyltransferase involved in cell wall biosynthesis